MQLDRNTLRNVSEKTDESVITYVSTHNPKNPDLFKVINFNLLILQEHPNMNTIISTFKAIITNICIKADHCLHGFCVYNQSLTTASESRLFGSVVRALDICLGGPGLESRPGRVICSYASLARLSCCKTITCKSKRQPKHLKWVSLCSLYSRGINSRYFYT